MTLYYPTAFKELQDLYLQRLYAGYEQVPALAVRSRHRIDRQTYAIKKIWLDGSIYRSRIFREVDLMAILRHPHVVLYYHSWIERYAEMSRGGDLEDDIESLIERYAYRDGEGDSDGEGDPDGEADPGGDGEADLDGDGEADPDGDRGCEPDGSVRNFGKEEMEDFGQLLPDEVLVDIFLRFTPKDVIRFKCVCKTWCRVISNTCVPIFSRNASTCGIHFRTVAMPHELIDEDTSQSICVWWGCKRNVKERFYLELRDSFHKHFMGFAPFSSAEPERELLDSDSVGNSSVNLYVDLLPFAHQSHAEEFVDSCNGLLLLVKEDSEYFVCNPTTKQCVAIPKPKACCYGSSTLVRVHAALAFDPSVSLHYKIVHFSLLDIGPPRLAEICIFSSCSGRWVQHRVPLGTSVREFRFLRNNVCLDGVLYMISMSWNILCFDVDAVSFRVIELPTAKRARRRRGCIGLWRGRLCYVKGDGPLFRLWSLDNPRGSHDWVLKYTVNVAELYQRFMYMADKFPQHHMWAVPCGIDPRSEAVFIGTSRQILRYFVENGKLQAVYESGEEEVLPTCYNSVFAYTSCLVPLKHFSGESG